MSVPHIRARSSKNALTPEDGRRNDRPKRRASVNRLEVDVNRPTDFNTNDSKLVMFYKIVHELVAVDHNKYLCPTRNLRSSRHNHDQSYLIPHTKQNFYLYSYFPSTIRLWNALDASTVAATSVEAFKHRMRLNRP